MNHQKDTITMRPKALQRTQRFDLRRAHIPCSGSLSLNR